MVGALVCMASAVVLLLSHLGKPMLAWRAIVNIRHSWISRGTVAIGFFILFGGLYVSGHVIPTLAFIKGANTVLISGAGITGIFVLFYPGLAMKASAGVAFWATPLLPFLSFLHGSLTGTMLVGVVTGEPITRTIENDFTSTCIALIILITAATYLYVRIMRGRDGASKVSADWLIKEERLVFWILAVGLGLVLPIALFLISSSSTALVAIVVVARIVGDIAFRYALLKVGAFESVA